MAGKKKKIVLNEKEKASLLKGYKYSKSHTFGKRCHIVLLKSEGRSSKEIGEILKITDQSVNNWLRRWEREGIEGLHTKPGRGRRPILDIEKDVDKVKSFIKNERQRISHAKPELERALGKPFSLSTLKRFLKKRDAFGNVSV